VVVSDRFAAAPHDAGTSELGSTQGSGYVHPAIATFIPVVSDGLAQPVPASMVADDVGATNVGTGRVGMVPVGVYEGKAETGPPVARVAGGHATAEVAEAGILPAPSPPTCQDFSGGVQGLALPQVPTACLGSEGSQSC
jgi:hypothetical protein